MNAIVVVDKNWSIGKDGDLLVHLPGDLKYYKEKTVGKVIVIGRKTLESFPGAKPLPNRVNLVLTGNKDYANDACEICLGEEALWEQISKYNSEDIFISGGQSIYDRFLEQCDTIYVTKIFEAFDADRYFRNMDEDSNYEMTWKSDIQEEKGIRYQFVKYERK
ncbi:MAG: dihydrofolate reductase [Anaerovoracaceae bacterium]